MSGDSSHGPGGATTFLFIIIVFFAIWVATGGPSRPFSLAGPYLAPVDGPGEKPEPYGDPNAFQSIQGTSWIPQFTVTNSPGATVAPSGSVGGDASPYRGVVTISRDSFGAKNTDPQLENIYVLVSYQAREPISTAGWRLASTESKVSIPFPQGSEVPSNGRLNTTGTITIRANDQLVVSSGRSPIGVSFRENKCTGYFEQHQDFTPALNQNCPSARIEYENLGDGDSECGSYISTLPYCTEVAKVPSSVSNSCEDFVEKHIHYAGCVTAHKNDTDFGSSSWRIYLGQSKELWKKHDTILLLDASGKTIDALSY